MKFFVPAAEDDAQAERVYEAFAKFVSAPVLKERVRTLCWEHNDINMECEVGKPLPTYYQTGTEPVLAIFDCGNLYKICTENRGGVRGVPVLAGKDHNTKVTYFDQTNVD